MVNAFDYMTFIHRLTWDLPGKFWKKRDIINFHNYWFLIWPSYFNLLEIRPFLLINSLKLDIEYTIIGYEYNFICKNVMYNLSFTTGVPVQSVIMLDWIQLSSSLDTPSSKSIIIGGISLLLIQFSLPYSFSIFITWSSAFAQTSFVILPIPP